MIRRRLRRPVAAAVAGLACVLTVSAVTSATALPARFVAGEVTATGARDWWVLGIAACGGRRCLRIVRTTDGGRTFRALPAAPWGDAGQDEAGRLLFADSRNGYAFGPELWSTHDGGRYWRRLPIGATDDVVIGGGYAYAYLTRRGSTKLMRSPIGRDRWRTLRTPRGTQPLALGASGRTLLLQTRTRVVISRDVGASFRLGGRLPAGTNCTFEPVPATPVIWALCFRAAAEPGGTLVRSVDGGVSWRVVRSTGMLSGPSTSLAVASADTVVVGGDHGAERTVDGGASWSAVAGLGRGRSVLQLRFTDGTHGLALAGTSTGRSPRLYVTTDAGATYHRRRIDPAPHPGRVAASTPCAQLPQEVQVSGDGTVSGCLRIGPVAAGRYTVSLQEDLGAVEAVHRKIVPSADRGHRDGPPVRLSLSPSSGPPGTVVTVRGRVSRPVSATGRSAFARGLGDFAWDGSPQGLLLLGRDIRWDSPQTFTARVAIPATPWIEGGAVPRVLGVRSGDYPLSVHCVTSAGGCAVSAPEGTVTFRLLIGHPPAWCHTASSCVALRLTPGAVSAGTVVRISGHAPLLAFADGAGSFIGGIRITRGRPPGGVRFTRHGAPSGGPAVSLGAARLRVLGPAGFSRIGPVRPLSRVSDGASPIAADPGHPGIVAWCQAEGIDMTVGGSVHRVAAAGVATALTRLGALPPGAHPALDCVDVLPLGPTTLLAAFAAGLPQDHGIAPPIADYAFETRNGGRTWSLLPTPRTSRPYEFGGFRPVRGGVEAVYAGMTRSGQGDAAHPVAERTGDAGAGWQASALSCPRAGPCVTFGPFLPGVCAMGQSTQDVLWSQDAGRVWRAAPILDPAKLACGDGQLIATGPRSALLVDALSDYPLQRTVDRGATWQSVALPPPNRLVTPGLPSFGAFGPGGVTLLPDGSLLLTGGGFYHGGWQLLRPGVSHWCPVRGQTSGWQRARQASSITVLGASLWWLADASTNPRQPARVQLRELPLSALRCR